MTTQQRRTIRYKGVKVRYTHKYVRENGFSYTNTDLDEENLRRVRKAYENYIDDKAKRYTRKGQYGKAIEVYFSLCVNSDALWYPQNTQPLELPDLSSFYEAMTDSSWITELNNQIKEQNESERL